MDGDGDLDLATAGAAAQNTTISANARLYRNDGADQFVEALSIFDAAGANLPTRLLTVASDRIVSSRRARCCTGWWRPSGPSRGQTVHRPSGADRSRPRKG